jgi:hypothetical protein
LIVQEAYPTVTQAKRLKRFFSINGELSFNQNLVTIHGSCVLEPLWDVS